jgi:hypothetical protein
MYEGTAATHAGIVPERYLGGQERPYCLVVTRSRACPRKPPAQSLAELQTSTGYDLPIQGSTMLLTSRWEIPSYAV